MNGRLEVVKWLLQNGAKAAAVRNNRVTAIYVPAENKHLGVVKWLRYAPVCAEERVKSYRLERFRNKWDLVMSWLELIVSLAELMQ